MSGMGHPSLISCDLEASNILPYARRPKVFISSFDNTPCTHKGAINLVNKEELINSISKETACMRKLGVWDSFDLDPIFKLFGNITEYKDQLCAQVFTHSVRVYFGKTYSPTGLLNFLCTLILFSSAKCLEFNQMDIKSAFLNSPLAKTVYLEIPQGLSTNWRKLLL
ncbi:hypothetical protein O181_127568 [Austropuccinia psidii MF-1]|uniref:Reverse transcriptase Ty1/copia-type domain-containing protein n=1 Tax=Austropuccinia psidii MF-1 TaxID=1389203 RepID=A0A9Q3Q730_9BASI|nr:hypothetical protein [Austropuccinia psidii MF-1]